MNAPARRNAISTILLSGAILGVGIMCSCGSEESTTSPNTLPQEHIEEQSGVTNSSGVTVFNDDGREVVVNVLSKDNTPLSDANVYYYNGPDDSPYEGFLVSASGHHPSVMFRGRHSRKSVSHTIRMLGEEVGNYALRTVFGTDEKQALMNFLDYYLPRSQTHVGAGIRYTGTRTAAQIGDAHAAGLNVGLFVATSVSGTPVMQIVSSVSHELPIGELIEGAYGGSANNWDTYMLPWLLYSNFTVDIVSNKPTVHLNPPQRNGDRVTFTWIAEDEDKYFDIIADPTKRIFGDLLCTELEVTEVGGPRRHWVGTCQEHWTFTITYPAQYLATAEVTDQIEINNTTSTETSTDRLFTIGDAHTIVIQPGPADGNDTYIRRGVSGQYVNENYGEEGVLELLNEDVWSSGEYRGKNIARILIQFDILSQLPEGAEVTTIKLHMYGEYEDNVHSEVSYCHRVDSSWSESTATWQNTSSSIEESILDGDNPGPGDQQWFTWDISGYPHYIQQIDGNGLAIQGVEERGFEVAGTFYSSENADAEHRPKLEIRYVVK